MNTTQTKHAWERADPFPHCVIDGFLPKDLMNYARNTVHEIPWPRWIQYSSPFEHRKSVCTDPDLVAPIRDFCHSPGMISLIERVTGLSGLITDPFLHGGGFHKTEDRGYLDLHLDYSHHPRLHVARALTLIIYLNGGDYPHGPQGGSLELWDMDDMEPRSYVAPEPNRAVLFQNTDKALHGHPDPLNSNHPRYSFACFYHTAPDNISATRPRALFFPRPGDAPNPEKDRLRAERAGLIAAP
jgi:hypothetical protein